MPEQKITKDMVIADIIKIDESLIPVLLNAGMHCVGCPSSMGETLEEAAEVHGIDADELCDLLNEFVCIKNELYIEKFVQFIFLLKS